MVAVMVEEGFAFHGLPVNPSMDAPALVIMVRSRKLVVLRLYYIVNFKKELLKSSSKNLFCHFIFVLNGFLSVL